MKKNFEIDKNKIVNLIDNLILLIKQNKLYEIKTTINKTNNQKFTYVNYCDKLKDFYEYILENNNICYYNYENVFEKKIEYMNYNELINLFVYYYRMTRFNETSLYIFIKSGEMLRCLEKMLTIINSE